MLTTEDRTFTMEDFEEIRPGLWKLEGRPVYAAAAGHSEPCEACRVRARKRCRVCYGRGRVHPLRNVERDMPGGACAIRGIAWNLAAVLERYNGPMAEMYRGRLAFFSLTR
jgi:hypothetical protein